LDEQPAAVANEVCLLGNAVSVGEDTQIDFLAHHAGCQVQLQELLGIPAPSGSSSEVGESGQTP